VIPWQYVDCLSIQSSSKVESFLKLLRLLRLLKLLRLSRISNLIKQLRYKYPKANFTIGLLQLLIALAMMAQWMSCLWFATGYLPDKTGSLPEASWLLKAGLINADLSPANGQHEPLMEWVSSLYWAVSTMATIGYAPPPHMGAHYHSIPLINLKK
jgi:hypothetical protein